MGLLSSLFAPRVGAATVYPGKHPSDPSLAGMLHGAGDTSAGVLITEYTALNLSAVWAAVNAISGGLAMMPLVLYRRQGQGKVPAAAHPAYRLTRFAPSPHTAPVAWQQAAQAHALTWGNGYSVVERSGRGDPLALHLVGPNRVTPDYDDGEGGVFYRVRNPAGQAESLVPAADVVHVAGLGWDGLCGYSVVRMAAESLGLTKATERFGATFFGNGARPSGLIKARTAIKKETRQELKESWERLHQGPSNAHRVAVLWGDMDYVALGIPPEDAQFLGTREFQTVEVCRWFQVSPHLLHDLSRATFSNIEELGRSFVTYTLGVWMVRWEQELARKLLRPEEWDDYFFEHDTSVLLRGNGQAQAAINQIRRQNGVINADEWREMDGLNPTADGSGQVYLVNSAMVRADVAGAAPAPESPPEAEPDRAAPPKETEEADDA